MNSALKRTGKLFSHRYHATYLKTPTQVRNTLRYVLLNRKHHAAERRFLARLLRRRQVWQRSCGRRRVDHRVRAQDPAHRLGGTDRVVALDRNARHPDSR